ncbi:hypothetical protein GCM10027093_54820 [Paraburkholderia jirisanensis]
MSVPGLEQFLGVPADSVEAERFFDNLATFQRPELDSQEEDRWYDWLLIKKQGIELGFVSKPYFEAQPRYDWKRGPLICCQVYFYRAGFNGRLDIHGYGGALPYGLSFTDSRDVVRSKLSNFAVRSAVQTDRWDTPTGKLHVRYAASNDAIDSVVIALPIHAWSEDSRTALSMPIARWHQLFGEAPTSTVLAQALAPLDVDARMQEQEEEREVDFTLECGLELYFEDLRQLRLPRTAGQGLGLGAVKFFRARDREAREWLGELPYGLAFEDSPERLFQKLGRAPDRHQDGRLTGFALWHFDEASLHVLYSNLDNQLQRITLMAPGYWSEAAELSDA